MGTVSPAPGPQDHKKNAGTKPDTPRSGSAPQSPEPSLKKESSMCIPLTIGGLGTGILGSIVYYFRNSLFGQPDVDPNAEKILQMMDYGTYGAVGMVVLGVFYNPIMGFVRRLFGYETSVATNDTSLTSMLFGPSKSNNPESDAGNSTFTVILCLLGFVIVVGICFAAKRKPEQPTPRRDIE